MLYNNFICNHLMLCNHFPNFNKLNNNMYQLQMIGLSGGLLLSILILFDDKPAFEVHYDLLASS